jgi:hypothetical protein
MDNADVTTHMHVSTHFRRAFVDLAIKADGFRILIELENNSGVISSHPPELLPDILQAVGYRHDEMTGPSTITKNILNSWGKDHSRSQLGTGSGNRRDGCALRSELRL